mmetsp:Transcript_31767/g.49707  ORF Transcript_31767/g.49707 Transcript_31767/m.49707 type:complete len:247 (-) Transcript_31767:580-1320(-)
MFAMLSDFIPMGSLVKSIGPTNLFVFNSMYTMASGNCVRSNVPQKEFEESISRFIAGGSLVRCIVPSIIFCANNSSFRDWGSNVRSTVPTNSFFWRLRTSSAFGSEDRFNVPHKLFVDTPKCFIDSGSHSRLIGPVRAKHDHTISHTSFSSFVKMPFHSIKSGLSSILPLMESLSISLRSLIKSSSGFALESLVYRFCRWLSRSRGERNCFLPIPCNFKIHYAEKRDMTHLKSSNSSFSSYSAVLS